MQCVDKIDMQVILINYIYEELGHRTTTPPTRCCIIISCQPRSFQLPAKNILQPNIDIKGNTSSTAKTHVSVEGFDF